MQKIFKGTTRNSIIFFISAVVMIQIRVIHAFGQEVDQEINKIRTVVIDAGHGGKDPGALGANSQEKDLALAISLKAGKYIEERIPGVKVIYTRKTDEFIPLMNRAKIANDNNADLFISIHINWSQNQSAAGTESLVLGLHRSNENFEVAKRENQVILLEDNYKVNYEGFDPNSEESYIMFSLMQYVYDEQSINLANDVQYQFRERAGRKDRGVRRQGLLVLAQSAMPGILIEAGFISNKKEEQFLMSEDGQDYIASAIFRAFRDYKQHIEGTTPGNYSELSDKQSVHDDKEITLKSDNAEEEKSAEQKPADTIKAGDPVTENQDEETVSDDSLVFKVQILYSENKIDSNNEIYKEFNDVEEINFNGKYKYVVGAKSSYNEAVEYSKMVKNRFPDAFIVAVSKGKIIPLSNVLKVKEN